MMDGKMKHTPKAVYRHDLQEATRNKLHFLVRIGGVRLSALAVKSKVSRPLLWLFMDGQRNLSRLNLEKVMRVLVEYQKTMNGGF